MTLVTKMGRPTLLYSEQGAIFSECGEYRHALWRVWDDTLPRLLWILLNPSTADENHSDPTNTRGERRAREMGFGANIFVNIFALRSPYPKALYEHSDPVDVLYNDSVLIDQMNHAPTW